MQVVARTAKMSQRGHFSTWDRWYPSCPLAGLPYQTVEMVYVACCELEIFGSKKSTDRSEGDMAAV